MTREELLRATLEAGRLRRANPHAPRGLLVGQAAPANGGSHPLLPFPRNCAGERLFRMSGWSLVDYLAWLDRFNTIATFPGSAASGKGDAFPLGIARDCAQQHFSERRMWSRVCLFVGKANAGCYGWDAPALPEPFTLHPQRGGGHWAWVPHTSGLVPFWNDPANRARTAETFTALMQKIFASGQN